MPVVQELSSGTVDYVFPENVKIATNSQVPVQLLRQRRGFWRRLSQRWILAFVLRLLPAEQCPDVIWTPKLQVIGRQPVYDGSWFMTMMMMMMKKKKMMMIKIEIEIEIEMKMKMKMKMKTTKAKAKARTMTAMMLTGWRGRRVGQAGPAGGLVNCRWKVVIAERLLCT